MDLTHLKMYFKELNFYFGNYKIELAMKNFFIELNFQTIF